MKILKMGKHHVTLECGVSLFQIFLSLAFLSFPGNISAQELNLKFQHLSMDDGLSSSKVNCIFQDSQGFMWLGTLEGLDKYDGYEFTVFQKDDGEPGELSGNFIQCIYEDSKGNLWIGTETGGLNLFVRSKNQFVHFTQDASSEIRISGNNIKAILEDSQGNLWLGTDNGLDLFDLKNKRATNYRPYGSGKFPANMNNIKALLEDSRNNLWIGTLEAGLCLFDRDKKTFEYFQHNPDDPNSISDNYIQSLYEDKKGNLYVGTYNGGLDLFDRKTNKFVQFYPDLKVRESLTIKAMMDDSKGNLWIATRNGLYLFNKKRHKFIRYAHDPHNPFSLSQNNVQAIYEDAKGDFWFGTKRGINLLNITSMPFKHYRSDAYNNKCLNHEVVSAILEDSQGDLWFGTVEGGLNRLDRKTGKYTYYVHDPNDPNSISSNNINSITEDKNGHLLIGTHQGGLNVFDRARNRFIHDKYCPENGTPIKLKSVTSLLLDRDGDLWLGSSSLYLFTNKNHKFAQFPLNLIGPETWDIQSIIQDVEGKIWVGGYDNKLYCIDKVTQKYDAYCLPGKTKEDRINVILEDDNHNLWIGAYRGGLYCFSKKEKTFTVYTKKDGLPSNIIFSLLKDDQGNLWMSTTRGLSKFNIETKTFKNYYKENGLPSNLFTSGACKTRSGEMFFGAINGAVAFYPDKIIENTYIPPVVITDFKVFNKSVKIGGENPILQKAIGESHNITLSYKQSTFTFTFAALDFAVSKQNQYAYKMEGFDTEWNYVGTRRFATYTNLNPGRYTFRVKGANNDGLWNEEGTFIDITILPPFWKTLWFKFIILVIVALTVKHFVNYQVQRRNLLKATALAHLTQLKLLRNQMNPHFLLNTLGSIRALVLIDRKQAWQMISELSEFFRYVLLNYNKVEASLNDEIDAAKNYICIQKVCFHDSLSVSYNVEDAARASIVPAFLLQPLIENAIKHGTKSDHEQLKIEINIAYNQGTLMIDVSNTGRLLLQHVDSTIRREKAHGASLKNIKERLGILFDDHFTFKLFEENGWVHVNIRIDYKSCSEKKQKKIRIADLHQETLSEKISATN